MKTKEKRSKDIEFEEPETVKDEGDFFNDDDQIDDDQIEEIPEEESKKRSLRQAPKQPIVVHARLSPKDQEFFESLAERYETDYAPDVIRQALRDALILGQQDNDDNPGEGDDEDERYASLLERIDRLLSVMEGQGISKEKEPEAPPSLEDETLAFANSLDSRGKRFLGQKLSEPFNPRHRNVNLGNPRSGWKDRIINFVNSICSWDGNRKSTDTANETRKNLLNYLTSVGILPK